MTKLNWRKFPDKVPESGADADEIIIVINKPFYEPYAQVCGYNEREHYFFVYRLHTDGEYDESVIDEHITHWIYADELPLPKE